ncbi:hypothetical protein RS3R2_15580 [Pseudomonas lactis]|nr:hypothetical protein RS3R2_15580 [Pseudomonas lactis]
MQSLTTLARARNLRRSATGVWPISSFCGFGGRVAAMKLRHSDRSLIAWALYFCVLMNLFACGLGHGQMMGQQLNGIGGLFCSVDGGQSPISDKGLANPSFSNISNYFACPVCNAVTVALVFLIGLAWLLGLTQTPRVAHERRNKAPPRYSWPSANPRASPAS